MADVRKIINDNYERFIFIAKDLKRKKPGNAEASELVSFLAEYLIKKEDKFLPLEEYEVLGFSTVFLRNQWYWYNSPFWKELKPISTLPESYIQDAPEEDPNTLSEDRLAFILLAYDRIWPHEKTLYNDRFVEMMKIGQMAKKHNISEMTISKYLKVLKIKLKNAYRMYTEHNPDWKTELRKLPPNSRGTSPSSKKIDKASSGTVPS